jgi:hypothetical protein
MVDCVEGGRQIEQHQDDKITGVHLTQYVCQNFEYRSFRRVERSVR